MVSAPFAQGRLRGCSSSVTVAEGQLPCDQPRCDRPLQRAAHVTSVALRAPSPIWPECHGYVWDGEEGGVRFLPAIGFIGASFGTDGLSEDPVSPARDTCRTSGMDLRAVTGPAVYKPSCLSLSSPHFSAFFFF